MNLTRTLCFFAIAAAFVSSFATQTHAQNAANVAACEAFNAAVAEKEGAFVVSGILAEETTSPPFPTGVDLTGIAIIQSFQTVAVDTPSITLPSGTLTSIALPAGDFSAGDTFTGIFAGADGFAKEAIIGSNGLGRATEFSLTPDPALGTAYGFCLVSGRDGNSFLGSPDDVVSIFDGDTLIGQVTGDDQSFFAAPGETITRIDFVGALVCDLQVAFCTDVPDPEVSNQECFENIAAEVGALADAATDSNDAYALNVASAALSFSAKDKFYEEDGNRLSRFGSNVFTGAAYAICYLEHTGVEGTEEIVDRILEKLEQIVDDEIAYAIENGGQPNFIERAEDFAEVAEWIDNELDNPFVATIAYKLAWANAYFATY